MLLDAHDMSLFDIYRVLTCQYSVDEMMYIRVCFSIYVCTVQLYNYIHNSKVLDCIVLALGAIHADIPRVGFLANGCTGTVVLSKTEVAMMIICPS